MEIYRIGSAKVHVALYTHLTNGISLRNRLVAASQAGTDSIAETERSKLNFAFIDASMITSRLHLLTAVDQALIAQADGSLKTKTIHSEILWELEPGNNIIDSLKNFGLSPTTTNLILVKVRPISQVSPTTIEDMYQSMEAIVDGHLGSLDLIGQMSVKGSDSKPFTNVRSLKKLYKVNQDQALAATVASSQDELRVLDELCIGSVALKAAS